MASYRHTIAPARFNDSFDLQHLHSVTVNSGANLDVITPGGSLDPAAVIMASAEPTVSFATHDLATMLANVSLTTGLKCTADSTLYYQRRADSATFTGSGTHQKLVAATAFVMLNSISATQDGPAEGTFTMYPFSSDGATQPIAYTDSVSLASSPAFGSKFFASRAKLGSTLLNGVTSVQYDNGMGFRYHAQDGYQYRTNGSIYMRQPTITITAHSITEAFSNVSPDIGNDSATNLKIYFQKGSSGSHRVALATAEHISITFGTAAWQISSVSGQNSDDVGIQLRATCIGTPTLSTATAIS